MQYYYQKFLDICTMFPLIFVLMSSIAILTLLFMGFMCVILFLDGMYRPNSPQYPFNVILDRIIPLIAILMPWFLILQLNPEKIYWIEKLFYIILIHIAILIPLITYWSKHRQWNTMGKNNDITTWDQPIFFLYIVIAMMYPAIWGIFLSMMRYLKLGTKINIKEKIEALVYFLGWDNIIVILFLTPVFFLWLIVLLKLFNTWRFWYWYNFRNVYMVVHFYCLRFYVYFYIFEKLYKLSFIIMRFIYLSSDIYTKEKNYLIFRYWLRYAYCNSWIIRIAICLFLILFMITELFFCGGTIYYFSYIVFLLPIVYAISYFVVNLHKMDWVTDVCNADYYACNWNNPRYKQKFWLLFSNSDERNGFNWYFSEQQLKEFSRIISNTVKFTSSTSHFMLPIRVKNKPYCIRLKAAYKSNYGIRWVHTVVPKPLHSATGYFVKGLLERINLINSGWRPHYAIILNAQKHYPSTNIPTQWYIKYPDPKGGIREIMEHNLVTNFLPLAERNVKIGLFDKSLHYHTGPGQVEPDIMFDFSNQQIFSDKRIHALDEKSGKKHLVNLIYTEMSKKTYIQKLERLRSQMLYSHPTEYNDAIMTPILKKLGDTCENLEQHKIVWATNLHHFGKFVPPLRIPQTFSLENATPQFRKEFNAAKIKMNKLSDYLYTKGVPQITFTDPMPIKALDAFLDSELQKILAE